jgi:hypothetical protein
VNDEIDGKVTETDILSYTKRAEQLFNEIEWEKTSNDGT